MSASQESAGLWSIGDEVPADGISLGELTRWELLVASPGQGSAALAAVSQESFDELIAFAETSLVERGKLAATTAVGEADDRMLAQPERTALHARASCGAGLTIRGPLPSAGIVFELHVADSFVVLDEYDDNYVHFTVLPTESWPDWLADKLLARLDSVRVDHEADISPALVVRSFHIGDGEMQVTEAVLGLADDGPAIAVLDDNEDLVVIPVSRDDLVAYLGPEGVGAGNSNVRS